MRTSFKLSVAAAVAIMVPNLAISADTYDISWDSAENKAVYSKNSGVAQDINGQFGDNELTEHSNNTVNINLERGIFRNNIYGGNREGTLEVVEGNKVNLISGKASYGVTGGFSTGVVKDNIVTISGGVSSNVSGGSSISNPAINNTVIILDGLVEGNVYGGSAGGSTVILETYTIYAAKDNTVTISGGKVLLNVYGGYAAFDPATYNTVNYTGGTIEGSIYGGYSKRPEDVLTGNTLNLGSLTQKLSNSLSAKNIYNFENLNFYLSSNVAHNAIALKLSDTGETDLSKSTVTVYLDNASNLDANSVVHLIQTAGSIKVADSYTGNGVEQANVSIGSLLNLKGYVKLTDNQNLDLVFNTPQPTVKWSSKDKIFNITEPDKYKRTMLSSEGAEVDEIFTITEKFDDGELVTITDATLSDGKGGNTAVSNSGNTVNVDLDTKLFDYNIFGGNNFSTNEKVSGNTVKLNTGTVSKRIYGGFSKDAEVSGNKVIINSGTVKDVFGGQSVNGKISGNEIIITDGIVIDAIYAGESNAGEVSNNIVTLLGGDTSKAEIFGFDGGSSANKNNTLNIGTSTTKAKNLKAGNIINFDNLNFYSDLSANEVALTLTGSNPTDLTKTAIKVNGTDEGYKAYLNGTDNKYYLLKSDGKIIVNDAWLKSTQSVTGNTFNVTSKTEYNVAKGGIFLSDDEKGLFISSAGGKLTETIIGDTFGDDEAGIADGITVNLNNSADYGDLAINLTKQTKINLANAKNVGEINAASSDVSIANSTLNGSTSVKSLNLSGTITAANDILAVNDITINKADLNLQDGLKSSNGNIAFNDSKGTISGDIEANKVSFVSGSNLNTITANDIKAKEIEFNLPNSAKYDSTALKLTTTRNTDLSSTKVSAFLGDASNLKGNGAIHLIQTAGKLTDPSGADVSGVNVNVAGLINVKANIELDSTNQNLDLKFNGTPSGSGGGTGGGGTGGVTANEGAKTLLETKLSQNTVVNEGANLFVSNLGNIANSANNANSDLSANGANSTNSNLDLGKAVTFAFVSGYDKEMTTGSHIDIKGFNANAGIAGNDYFSSGNLTTGLFVEYGEGEYDSFLDDGTKGSGKTEFIGGGAFARFTTLNNFYTEVSGRVGQVKTKYETTAAYKGFDISNTYYGAHLGFGKEFALSNSNDLDIFARGIWAKTAGNDIVLNGVKTHFDSVTSLRAQVGLKDNIKFSDTSKLYVGASYQYEFDGEAKGTLSVPAINAVADIASPKLKGSTGIGEIGYVYENSSIKFEAGAKGYVGKEKGYSGNLGVTFKF